MTHVAYRLFDFSCIRQKAQRCVFYLLVEILGVLADRRQQIVARAVGCCCKRLCTARLNVDRIFVVDNIAEARKWRIYDALFLIERSLGLFVRKRRRIGQLRDRAQTRIAVAGNMNCGLRFEAASAYPAVQTDGPICVRIFGNKLKISRAD